MKKWTAVAAAAHCFPVQSRPGTGKRSSRDQHRALSTALSGRKLRGRFSRNCANESDNHANQQSSYASQPPQLEDG